MLILAKSILAVMLGFTFSVVFGLFLIPLVKKLKMSQRVSSRLDNHQEKEGTPTMGGLIFVIPTVLASFYFLLTDKISFSNNLLIVLFVFISYSLIGFVDDLLIIKRKNNTGLAISTKLFLQIIIALVFFFIYMRSGAEPLIWIYSLNIKVDIGWLYGIFLLLVLVGSSNAVNITDGLDGLAGGLSAIAFFVMGVITWGTPWLSGYQDIGIFCLTLTGSIMGFLVYNTNPARIFMGDTGSLTLGATLATIAILNKHEMSLLLIGGVFIIETLTVIIQVTSIKLFKKRIFLFSPLHHHFEKLGWKETDIVKLFWTVGFILGMFALIYGVWI